MSDLEKNLDNTSFLLATKNLEDFIKKVNYAVAQHEILDSLANDLRAQKITRVFKVFLLVVSAIFIFFINTTLPNIVDIVFKVVLLLCFALMADFVFSKKLDIGKLQSRMFQVTMSTNLMFLNDEYIKGNIKRLEEEKKRIEVEMSKFLKGEKNV